MRYDHLGHGETSAPPEHRVETYDFDDFCRHIHSMVEAVTPGRPPFAIMGCSMGGVLAIKYALMYPGSLTKVVSCDAPGLTSLEVSKPKWKDRIAMYRAEGVAPLAKATVDRWFPNPCPPDVREQALKQTMACSLAGYRACAHGIMNYDYTSELDQITQEDVMVLAGENDEAIGPPEILVDVASRIKGAQHVVMKDTGHIPPQHQPQEFERIVIEFLTT